MRRRRPSPLRQYPRPEAKSISFQPDGSLEAWGFDVSRMPLRGFKDGWLSPDFCWLAWADGGTGLYLHDLENDTPHGWAGWSPDMQVSEARFNGGHLWLRLNDGSIHPLPLSVFPGPEARTPEAPASWWSWWLFGG